MRKKVKHGRKFVDTCSYKRSERWVTKGGQSKLVSEKERERERERECEVQREMDKSGELN